MNLNPFTWDAPWFIIAAGLFVIVMLRANGTYWLGRLIERGARRTRMARLMETPGYEKAVDRLNRWGAPVVTLSFLTIGVQTLINLAAGATRMPLRRYLPAMTIGCVLWAIIYATAGFIGFEGLALLWELSPVLTLLVGAAVISSFVAFIVFRVREGNAGRVAVPAVAGAVDPPSPTADDSPADS